MEEKTITITTDIGVKELYEFTMNNNYKSIRGIISVLFSIISGIGVIVFWNDLSPLQRAGVIFFALMFTVIVPIEYYYRAKKQVKKSFNTPLIYEFSNNGIKIKQDDNAAESMLEDVMKITTTKNLINIYMSPIRAFILPKKDIGDDFQQLKDFLEEKTSCYKFKMEL